MRIKLSLAIVLFVALHAQAYSRTISFSLAFGFFSPKQEEFREMYGRGTPMALEVRVNLLEKAGILAGWQHLNQKGRALGPGDEDYPLRLSIFSFPIGVFLELPLGKFRPAAAVGATYCSFKEEWETVDLGFKGKKWGYFGSLSLAYPLYSAVHLTAALVYEDLPTGRGSPLVGEVNLGGVKILAGLSVFLF